MPPAADRTSEFFQAYARDFDAIYGTRNTWLNRLINALWRRSMKLRYEETLKGCAPITGKRVLDAGCGPGHYAVALARRGAGHVLGLDFAPEMLELARARAAQAGVADRCRFELGDFLTYPLTENFDYAVVMGFMDYVREPAPVIAKVLQATKSKAFFSFPAAGGLLAWQRRLRYQQRCELFLYSESDLRKLFGETGARWELKRLARDHFVTVYLTENRP
ncbi:MAG: methyltransferase domain-containing protein [Deltaproteobacteria bacterium]|nr:methyltransferase domain-containing protein [Deltaproteobacteria bacterium]MBI4796355.1 methyltransferase domain-containing protein [Deltaproteobacteria bacterium]